MRVRRAAATLGPAALVVVLQQLLFPAPAGVVARGVVVGLLASLVALGMALVHRTHGVLNLAQADLGAVPAVVTVLLVVQSGLPWLVAVGAGLVLAAGLGLVLDVAALRRLTARSPLVATVATIGIAQALVGIATQVPRLWGERLVTARLPAPFGLTVTVGDVTFDATSVLAVVAVPVAVVAVAVFLERSRAGLAVRAAAEAPARAATLGIPVDRVRAVVWVIAAVLAFVAAVLRAGIVGLPVGSSLTLGILLRALAALVLGRRGGLPGVAAAAVAIGVLEQGVAWGDWRAVPVPDRGGAALVDPVLAVVVLLALAAGRSTWAAAAGGRWRGAIDRVGAPRRAVLAVLLGGAVVVPHLLDAEGSLRGSVAMVYATLGLSVVVVTGWSGQLSLAQAAFFGLGAAAGAGATATWDLDLALAAPLAGAAGAAGAALIGVAVVRLRGIGLAVGSLAAALAATAYLLDVRFFGWLPDGRVERPPLLGRLPLDSPTRVWYVTLAALVLALVAVHGIRASPTGRATLAVRDGERAAAAFGIAPVRARVTAFAVGGAVAAFAGSVFVHHQQSFDLSSFDPLQNLVFLAMVVIGGVGSAWGAVLGALYYAVTDWLLPASWRSVATGVGLVVVLVVAPGGLVALRPGRWAPGLAAAARPASGSRTAATAGASASGGSGLVVRGLHAERDATPVLFGVDLHVAPGEVLAVLGPNGAGKSSLLRAVAGLVPATRGTVELDGRRLSGLAPHDVARAGVVLVPGGEAVFGALTVDEHLRLARMLDRDGEPGRPAALAGRGSARAGDLSGGQQQLLGLAMAAAARARLVLVDELSLGLAPAVVATELEPLVARWRSQGTGVVLVEQSLPLALRLADRVAVLDKGEVRYQGDAGELRDDPSKLAAILLGERGDATADAAGATASVAAPLPSHAVGRPVTPPGPTCRPAGRASTALGIAGVTKRFGGVVALAGVDLEVSTGEVVGIVGPNGAGKTTLFDIVSGFAEPDAGTVRLAGVDVTRWSAARRAQHGLGRSFQQAGSFPTVVVAEALAIAQHRWFQVQDPISAALHLPAWRREERHQRRTAEAVAERFDLTPWLDVPVGALPAGVRRLVDLAAVVLHRPTVVLLDEPSSGVATGDAAVLAGRLRQVRDDLDATVLVIEHDLAVVRAVADRLIVLDRGRVLADGPPASVLAEPDVVAAYGGGSPVGT